MNMHPARRTYQKHHTVRTTRLKANGQSTWIRTSMVDWSAAGASLSGPVDKVPLGAAMLSVSPVDGTADIHLSCEVIWRQEGKIGLRLIGPVPH